MSATAQLPAHQPGTIPPGIDLPTPPTTPQKRKISEASVTFNYEQEGSKMARLNSQTPISEEVSGPTRQYGIYVHDITKDSADAKVNTELVAIASDWNSAYEALRIHAAGQIDVKATWGASKGLATKNMYEILDSKNMVKLRYDMDAIVASGKDADGTTIWERLKEPVVASPPIHYGLYVEIYPNDEYNKEEFFAGGYKSLGEASHAMKMSATAFLNGHSGAQMMDRCIELVDERGKVGQRYIIRDGRWRAGGFVKEEDWVGRVARPRPGVHGATPPLSSPSNGQDDLQDSPLGSESAALLQKDAQSELDAASPELHGTRSSTGMSRAQTPNGIPLWCSCRLPDDGSLMIECENFNCAIAWFHGRCVGIRVAPAEDGVWFCPACRAQKADSDDEEDEDDYEEGKTWERKTLARKTMGKGRVAAKTPKGKAGGGGVKAKGTGRKRKSN